MNMTDDNKNKNDPNLKIKPTELKGKIDNGELQNMMHVKQFK